MCKSDLISGFDWASDDLMCDSDWMYVITRFDKWPWYDVSLWCNICLWCVNLISSMILIWDSDLIFGVIHQNERSKSEPHIKPKEFLISNPEVTSEKHIKGAEIKSELHIKMKDQNQSYSSKPKIIPMSHIKTQRSYQSCPAKPHIIS